LVFLPVDLEKAVISRLTVSGKKFEILVDSRKALEFKKGGKINMEDALAYPAVYKDARSTDIVPEQDLQKAFGTTDVYKVAEKIIRRGELQLTTEQRREMVEQKKTQIAEIISKRGVNPQTGAPHPPQRILNALAEAGVAVDPFTEAEAQVGKVLDAIKPMLPIKFENVVVQLKVPPQYAGRVYPIIKNVGTVVSESWLNDGSLRIDVKILGGMQNELFDRVSSLTHGNFESKIMAKEDA
jgi:ribosome maturation protein SDO1